MTAEERIAELERKLRELEERVISLEAIRALLGERTYWVPAPWQPTENTAAPLPVGPRVSCTGGYTAPRPPTEEDEGQARAGMAADV